jgi:V/A-type H+-transporting ATPase subunit I
MKIEDVARPGLLALGVVGVAATALLGFAAATGSALADGQGVLGRIGSLLQSLMRLPSALGDVLSYLRLFALAYAGAALAGAFNGLAAPLAELAGFGGLLAALLLVFGHGLNIVLSVMGGFVHGLRLNFIEFFNWAGIEEGRPFKAFKRQEAPPWTPP